MSYAYGEIIFGWAWTSELEEAIRELSDEQREELGMYDYEGRCSTDDANALGFKTYYSASGDDISGYLGVKLDNMPVYTARKMSEFKVTPTKKQREEVMKKIEHLPESLRKCLGKPDTWVVWGDS